MTTLKATVNQISTATSVNHISTATSHAGQPYLHSWALSSER
jgi:hypothetical protein